VSSAHLKAATSGNADILVTANTRISGDSIHQKFPKVKWVEREGLMSDATRPYRGVAAADRRAMRRAALMDAAIELAARDGVASLTVRGVSRQAGLNDRYFYESFRTLDELTITVWQDLVARASTAIVAAIAASPAEPVARARAAITRGFDFLIGDQRLGCLLIESEATAELRNHRRTLVRTLAHIMAQQGRTLLGEQTVPTSEIKFASITIVAGGLELVTQWLRGEIDATRQDLEDFLIGMITRA
jgi:AcrR family transcriptional regulator